MWGSVREFCAAFVFLAGTQAAFGQTVNHPPVEAFGDLPHIREPQISPDGKHVAAIQLYNGRPILCIYTVNAPDGTQPALAKSDDWLIGAFRWVKNDRLVVYLTKDAKLGVGYEDAGRLTNWGRALSVNAEGKDTVVLFGHNMSLSENGGVAGVADLDLGDPDNVFIPFLEDTSMTSPDEILGNADTYHYNMMKVNVRDGHAEPVARGSLDTDRWIMDGQGQVVARFDRKSNFLDEQLKILDKGEWRDGTTFDVSEGHGTGILGVSDDKAALVQLASGASSDLESLHRFDLATGKWSPLFAVPRFDIDWGIEDDWTGRIIGARYIDDRYQYVYFDPALEALQRGIEAAFPGLSTHAVSTDTARDLAIVAVDGPRAPLTYYLLDRTTHQATRLGQSYPGLSEDDLGEMKPYPYMARDGLPIPAYLTLPPGKPAHNLPTVIFPHGGPRDRDEIGFDWWAQFMANRGYAVLQPNFRGSSGYGDKFLDAGKRQWGLKMQDDITDGVKKLIADGIADPKRICIVGASYGGYAALAGATFTPDLYACAVSVAGVSDLPTMLRAWRKESGNDAAARSDAESLVGSTSDDADRLDATSPALHADQVKCPVLLLHGENDTTVPIVQTETEDEALQKAGKNVKFVRLVGDDHYLKLSATRITMLKEIESFLATNIGN